MIGTCGRSRNSPDPCQRPCQRPTTIPMNRPSGCGRPTGLGYPRLLDDLPLDYYMGLGKENTNLRRGQLWRFPQLETTETANSEITGAQVTGAQTPTSQLVWFSRRPCQPICTSSILQPAI